MSTPQTSINIVSGVSIDSRYRHTIYFPTQTKQLEFFSGKTVKRLSAYSYCRKSWDLKVEADLEQARTWNYLYFQNSETGKWWFYFIDQVEYKGDRCVILTLQLDVIQTYMFDWILKPCFIERQHTPTDVFGENQVEENLDTGELTCVGEVDITEIEDLCVLLLATFNPLNTTDETNMDKVFASRYNGIFGGMGIFAVPMTAWQGLGTKLSLLDDAGLTDGIVSMWMYPKNLVKLGSYNDGTQATWDDAYFCKPVKSMEAVTVTLETSLKPKLTINGYTPVNKKTLQYPYQFLYVSNNQGGGAVYRYERFTEEITNGDNLKLQAKLYGCYSPEGTVKLAFPGYDNMTHETSISIGGYPTCAWNVDAYKIWLAQNQNSQNLSNALGALSIKGGLVALAHATGTAGLLAGAGAILSGAQTIAQNLATKQDRSIQPPQARGNHSSSTNIVAGKQTFTLYFRCVTREQAKIIDDYFTMYGYQINRVAVPNIHARSQYTYIKTNGCTVNGAICNEDRLKIESVFDNGITFWTDGWQIGQYPNGTDTGGESNDPLGEGVCYIDSDTLSFTIGDTWKTRYNTLFNSDALGGLAFTFELDESGDPMIDGMYIQDSAGSVVKGSDTIVNGETYNRR